MKEAQNNNNNATKENTSPRAVHLDQNLFRLTQLPWRGVLVATSSIDDAPEEIFAAPDESMMNDSAP